MGVKKLHIWNLTEQTNIDRSFSANKIFWDHKRSRTVMVIMDRIALIITIIGALNWGSIGLFGFDIVAWICGGQGAVWSRIIYTIVALAGIWCISLIFRARESIEPIEQHWVFPSGEAGADLEFFGAASLRLSVRFIWKRLTMMEYTVCVQCVRHGLNKGGKIRVIGCVARGGLGCICVTKRNCARWYPLCSRCINATVSRLARGEARWTLAPE